MKNKMFKFSSASLSLFLIVAASSVSAQQFTFPTTISEEAQKAGASLVRSEDPLPKADDISGWKELQDQNEDPEAREGRELAEEFGATITEISLGGVRALDVKPKDWSDNGKVLIYTHGGAYTLFSVTST